ncbi:threonine synthase [Aerococcus urinae]|uniref:Threonine synthase n=1 Tax=Aerococcus mictus TaxID=2976810 RepID=A0A1E9PSG9_9LACT|nr:MULTISPECIES: threonine synthase [Aerococcus]KAA9292812.1 threonine synthase [Aerococcus mictus]MBU5610687.1 threonine synthase [Aerococcus urinae]MCY3033790.1 threonine synthase [Aerococcus mictus]MCY3063079.1 threonine synthase [Aerococcus mictus]MCY3065093.1 threonine synthase [Aerococcus mictus]
MLYTSTRNNQLSVRATEAILQGLAPDGGLYVPESIPHYEGDWETMSKLSYQELAFQILSLYFDDFPKDILQSCIQAAYDEKFDDDRIAPVVGVSDHYLLELFHGPTIAFKDMALSLLPHLMKAAQKVLGRDEEIIILTATSGDTGKAAMAGFEDVTGTKIIVFYPKGGVSSIQEKQMLTQKGDNTYVFGVKGNFDDAQSKVKELFNDKDLAAELQANHSQFSSANSMNIGRLFPQVVYYFYAYGQLLKQGAIQAGDLVNFTVPTGNFGNILAGYYAKQMGLPIDRLVCASNDNTVLYDFFTSGTYDRRRPFKLTISPSMDILVSSNLERLLYYAVGQDSQAVKDLMAALQDEGHYQLGQEVQAAFDSFIGAYSDEAETRTEIKRVYQEDHYLMDPHTAVASACLGKVKDQLAGESIVVSTASPFKFPAAVLESIAKGDSHLSDLELLEAVQAANGLDYPQAIQAILEADSRPERVIEVEKMETVVREIAKG